MKKTTTIATTVALLAAAFGLLRLRARRKRKKKQSEALSRELDEIINDLDRDLELISKCGYLCDGCPYISECAIADNEIKDNTWKETSNRHSPGTYCPTR